MTHCREMVTRNATYHEWHIWDPHFWGRGGHRKLSIVPFERATVISYTLPIVIIALSLTIRPQFATECLRCSNQQGWVTLGQNFKGVPFGIDL